MIPNFTVVYDACVLYPNTLRDLLMELATRDLYRAKWTAEIHDEWIRNLKQNKPDLPIEKLDRVKDLMNENVRDCLVTDYQWLIEKLNLPDSSDRHVLAAAIKAQRVRADNNKNGGIEHFYDLSVADLSLLLKLGHADLSNCLSFFAARSTKTQNQTHSPSILINNIFDR